MPVDSDLIVATYLLALQGVKRGADFVHAAVAAHIPDPTGAIAWAIRQAVDKVREHFGLTNEAIALFVAVHVEYRKRTGSFSAGSGWFSLLSNQCGVQGCGLKGHNRQNHPSDLRGKLKRAGVADSVFDQLCSLSG